MIGLEPDEKAFYDLLLSREDSQGIIRYDPSELEHELRMMNSEIEQLLEKLYERGILVYITRINKKTGEMLKVVQLITEEDK